MMGAVTYPEPLVIATVNEYFVPVQINTQEEQRQPVVARYRQVWTPDVRILAPDGFDLYAWNGYLPPAEYVPRLLSGLAHSYMRMNDDVRAAAIYTDVLRRFPTSDAAPEAQYWRAVARYKHSHEPNDLLGGWRQVRLRYPMSIWRTKQLFNEDAERDGDGGHKA